MNFGAVVGLLFAAGAWLIASRLSARRFRLVDRVAPYLRTESAGSTLLNRPPVSGPLATFERLLTPVVTDMGAWLTRLLGGAADVKRRLAAAGSPLTVEAFRAQQVLWGAASAAAAALGTSLLLAVGRVNLVGALVLIVLGGALGVLGRDYLLSRNVARRNEVLAAQLPTIAELLSLAVSAGESTLNAIERVAACCHGELSAELDRLLADVRSGDSLVRALEKMGRRTDQPALARFAEGVAVATERGTPLAEVLRAQAQDARDTARQHLLETGGRKEITMMLPVIFVVLPVTILFAIYPGIIVLQLGP